MRLGAPARPSKVIIHVNRHIIAKNRKDGGGRPVYAIKYGRETVYAHRVTVEGTVAFVDPRDEKPLPCGAKIYAVAEGEVTLSDPIPFQKIGD